MSSSPTAGKPAPLTVTAWLIVVMAAIGFAFDIYELLMLPLIIRPAIAELSGPGATAADIAANAKLWKPWMFFLPAMVGGAFGLLGGYLTDRLGRRRVLTWSILLYSISAFLGGFSTSLGMLLFFRCTKFIGVCVEFVAAISWLAELFPNKEQKERVLGYTQAFSSFGGILVAIVNGFLLDKGIASHLPAISIPPFLSFIGTIAPDPGGQFVAWRYTMMSGLIPALPLLIIRPFLPESPAWQQKKEAGTLKRPSFGELFSPGLARTTIVTTIMVACGYGVAFGAIQQMQDIIPGLSYVREKVADAPKDKAKIEQTEYNNYNKVQEIGGLFGRFAFALLAVPIVSRRALLRIFQLPALVVVPAVFWFFLTIPNTEYARLDLSALKLHELPITNVSIGVFVAGFLTVAQFSFWGNYLPRVYPVHLRGTGESFAMNIGGRMIGTAFAAVTSYFASDPASYAHTSAIVAFAVTLVAAISCFFLPEPRPEIEE
ncbi:MAG: MFS transporter [Gemmataceae bacterium]